MSTTATRQKFKLQCTLAAALSLAAVSAFAQTPKAPLLGVYVGAHMGIGAQQWECTNYSACNRASFSGKALAGYRMTPGLAAEINYMYFGAVERTNDGANELTSGISVDRQTTKAATIGINWEVDLLHHFVNSLRIGWAFKQRDNDVTRITGATTSSKVYDGALYAGAGLSWRMTETLRFRSDFDYIVDGQNSNYLFSAGIAADF